MRCWARYASHVGLSGILLYTLPVYESLLSMACVILLLDSSTMIGTMQNIYIRNKLPLPNSPTWKYEILLNLILISVHHKCSSPVAVCLPSRCLAPGYLYYIRLYVTCSDVPLTSMFLGLVLIFHCMLPVAVP